MVRKHQIVEGLQDDGMFTRGMGKGGTLFALIVLGLSS